MAVLKEGSSGPAVKALQRRLKDKGFDPGLIDGAFGPGTEAAVIAFQRSERLAPDGIAGPRTLARLAGAPEASDEQLHDVVGAVTVNVVARMCPFAPIGNIKKYSPDVLAALQQRGLGDRQMVLMAMGTIRAETGRFEPISEFKSRFNSSPNGHPFDLYDNRKDLGNRGPPDGDSFKGRGFIQLTGRANYRKFGQKLGIGNGLAANPEMANDASVAASLLALFLKDKEAKIRKALMEGDLAAARKLVNGAHHGLADFTEAYRIGDALLR